MKKIYALLVGIDDYPSPISRLNGCVKDVNKVAQYLKTYHGPVGVQAETPPVLMTLDGLPIQTWGSLQICQLLNEAATYQQIVKAFRSFLCVAEAEDMVWFHFSGHGSEEWTAEQFLPLEPNGKDQTLVCYQADPEEDRLHLADKEIAVLLHEVASQDKEGKPKECPPHILVSLDCCHSGSGTRDLAENMGYRTRNFIADRGIGGGVIGFRPAKVRRNLDTYLDGVYLKMLEKEKELQVPLARHLLISACSSIEKAGDLPTGGVFTNSLVNALDATAGQLNYADLYLRTKANSNQARKAQNPQFESIGNFNPYTRFLDGTPMGRADRYVITFEEGRWVVKCGAIHGLPTKPVQAIKLLIRNLPPEEMVIGETSIKAVGALKSEIQVSTNLNLDTKRQYYGLLYHFPAEPVFVYLHGSDEEALQDLKDAWEETLNIRWLAPSNGADQPAMEVKASDRQYIMYDVQRNLQLFAIPQVQEAEKTAAVIFRNIVKIVKWNRMILLDHQKSRLKPKLKFILETRDKKGQVYPLNGPEIKLYLSLDKYFHRPNDGVIGLPINPKIRIIAQGRPLYCYLLHLREDYSINAYEGPVSFHPSDFEGQSEVLLPLWKKNMGLWLLENDWESTSYFKILITTQPIEHEQFLQSKLGSFRAMRRRWSQLAKADDDWCSFTMKVNLIQTLAQIQSDQVVSIADGQVRILPHSGIQAKLSWIEAPWDPQSADPVARFRLFTSPDLELIHFDKKTGTASGQVLVFTELNLAENEDFDQHPLSIELNTPCEEAETIVPLCFDGQDFRIAGHAQPQGDKTLVKVTFFPKALGKAEKLANGLVPNPFDPTDHQHPSLYEGYPIAFFKVKRTFLAQGVLPWN
ncbi:MAG: caspase family protein [Saprospiraceae bacterium]